MTTNHIEQLNPALIRPGRIDLQTELGFIGATTARRLFDRFFPMEPTLGKQFEIQLGDHRFSPVASQGWLLANCDNPAGAANAHGLLRPTSEAAQSDIAATA